MSQEPEMKYATAPIDNFNEVKSEERTFAFTSTQKETLDLSNRINGWGADLDPANRPGVPMDKAPLAGIELLYPNIEMQISDVEVLKSVEHQMMPPVFGTTCPPKGLSGMLRRFAFRSSEGQFTHWLTLMLADRVDMVEHDLSDLLKGKVPNLYKEMGLASEWKYNRQAVIRKAAIAGGIALLAGSLWMIARKRDAKRIETYGV